MIKTIPGTLSALLVSIGRWGTADAPVALSTTKEVLDKQRVSLSEKINKAKFQREAWSRKMAIARPVFQIAWFVFLVQFFGRLATLRDIEYYPAFWLTTLCAVLTALTVFWLERKSPWPELQKLNDSLSLLQELSSEDAAEVELWSQQYAEVALWVNYVRQTLKRELLQCDFKILGIFVRGVVQPQTGFARLNSFDFSSYEQDLRPEVELLEIYAPKWMRKSDRESLLKRVTRGSPGTGAGWRWLEYSFWLALSAPIALFWMAATLKQPPVPVIVFGIVGALPISAFICWMLLVIVFGQYTNKLLHNLPEKRFGIHRSLTEEQAQELLSYVEKNASVRRWCNYVLHGIRRSLICGDLVLAREMIGAEASTNRWW